MAGSVNLANVALGFDASQVVRGVDMTAGEMRKLNGIFQGSISNLDKYNAEMAILEKANAKGAFTADRLAQAQDHLAKKYGVATQEVNKQAAAHTKSSGGITSELKGMAAAYIGVSAAISGLKTSLSLAATAESDKIALEVLTGSAIQAKKLFDGFIELDRSSPLSKSDFSRAAQTLIGYGFAAQSTLPALRSLSEISIGNADRFQSLALAFGQVSANGRLMGQEVLQMVNAGFNPLQEISRTTGRSMIELKKAMEDGAISSSMVEAALKSATSEGGRFYEMNERLKNSAAGQFAKMKSDVELLATEIGTNLMPTAKAFMDLMNMGKNKDGTGQSGLGYMAEVASDGIRIIGATLSDAGTNMDENKRGTAITDLQDEIQTRMMERKMKEEKGMIHKNTPEEEKRIAANMEKRAKKERDDIAAIAKAEKDKAEEKKAREKETAEAVKMQKDKEAADLNKAREEDKKRRNDQLEAARQLGQATLTPIQEYNNELKRINDLYKAGVISEETRDRGLDRAGNKLIKQGESADNSNALGVSQTIAPALKAGSVEAYKFMLGQKDKLYEAAQEQKELSTEHLDIAKQQLAAAQQQPKVGLRR